MFCPIFFFLFERDNPSTKAQGPAASAFGGGVQGRDGTRGREGARWRRWGDECGRDACTSKFVIVSGSLHGAPLWQGCCRESTTYFFFFVTTYFFFLVRASPVPSVVRGSFVVKFFLSFTRSSRRAPRCSRIRPSAF